MVLPDKYTKLQNSLFGLSAIIIKVMRDNCYTIEQIWKLSDKYAQRNKINLNYDKFLQVVIFMYAYKVLENGDLGGKQNENFKIKHI